MPRAYRTVRDHLDDIVGFARCVFEQRRTTKPARLAELQFEINDRADQIEASLELARIANMAMPLDRLRKAFKLEKEEIRTLYLLLGLAVSSEVRGFADSDGTATLELIDQIIYAASPARDKLADHLAVDGRLFGYGLVEFVDESRSRLARPVRVTDRVVDLALGRDRSSSEIAGLAALAIAKPYELEVSEEAARAVRAALVRHLEWGSGAVPVIRGPARGGRRALVATVAHELGARMLVVDGAALAERIGPALTAIKREAILAGAVIVISDADRIGAARMARIDAAFAHYAGPIAMTIGPGELPAGWFASRGTLVVDVPPLTEAQRAKLWARSLPDALAAEVAARYRLTGREIEQTTQQLKQRDGQATLADVHAAVCAVVDNRLGALGTHVAAKPSWSDLVLPQTALDELREIVARVRQHKRVVEDWGFDASAARGVSALFHGPAGTGKTMAAAVIANELGLELYQIDLARTDKLAQAFEAASTGHAVLLFDHADAWLGDRAAVAELHQRIDAHEGIVILATASDVGLDETVRRRLAFRIGFPLPGELERAHLWRAAIPATAPTGMLDLHELAATYAMSGGHIKNAAVRAAYLAAADGSKIEMRHLKKAASAELLR